MRLLVVDDDVSLARTLAEFLMRQGYAVDMAADGELAWEFVQSNVYDLIVLDVLLPKLDGVSLCQSLRQQGYTLPILLLTICDSSGDKVAGLDAGADDYVIKPFDWQELLARIRALLRRDSSPASPMLTWGALSLNPSTCEVTYNNQPVALRPREYKLLELFLHNPNRVFSCGAILEHLWSLEDPPSEETVRSHIKGLRQHLQAAGAAGLIETVYGLGYRLKAVEAKLPDQPSPSAAGIHPGVVSELQRALADTWAEVKPEILEQVTVLDQAIRAMQTGPINAALQQQAIAQAHRLAGTVGTYGFKWGSYLARSIEKQLQLMPLDPHQLASLNTQVSTLQRELSGPPTVIAVPAEPLFAETLASVRLLAVDDDPHLLTTLQTMLQPWSLTLATLSDSRQFWRYLNHTNPDLLLLDVAMPNVDGVELCEEIRSHPQWTGLPIVFLTAYTDSKTVQRVLRAGADDIVSKPIVGSELVTRIAARIERRRFWQQVSEQDGLTRLTNRVKFTQDFRQLLQTAEQRRQSVLLVVLAIDRLRSINYDYGYEQGDTLLRLIGAQLNRWRQTGDLIARWSGSKFAIALYGPTPEETTQRLSSLLTSLETTELTTPEGEPLPLMLKTGRAHYPQEGTAFQALYRAAELSLLQSV